MTYCFKVTRSILGGGVVSSFCAVFILLEYSGFPSVVTSLAHFYQKDMCGSYYVATVFTQHFVPNCSQFVIL